MTTGWINCAACADIEGSIELCSRHGGLSTAARQLRRQSEAAAARRQAIVDCLSSYDVHDSVSDSVWQYANELMAEIDELTVTIEERSATL